MVGGLGKQYALPEGSRMVISSDRNRKFVYFTSLRTVVVFPVSGGAERRRPPKGVDVQAEWRRT